VLENLAKTRSRIQLEAVAQASVLGTRRMLSRMKKEA
jgi:hypothetical protein